MAGEKMAGPGSRTSRQLGLWRQGDAPFRLSPQSARELVRLVAELLVAVVRRKPEWAKSSPGRREP